MKSTANENEMYRNIKCNKLAFAKLQITVIDGHANHNSTVIRVESTCQHISFRTQMSRMGKRVSNSRAEFLASFAEEASHIPPEHGTEEAVDERVDDGINHEHSFELICDGQTVVLEEERQPAEDEDGGNN